MRDFFCMGNGERATRYKHKTAEGRHRLPTLHTQNAACSLIGAIDARRSAEKTGVSHNITALGSKDSAPAYAPIRARLAVTVE